MRSRPCAIVLVTAAGCGDGMEALPPASSSTFQPEARGEATLRVEYIPPAPP